MTLLTGKEEIFWHSGGVLGRSDPHGSRCKGWTVRLALFS